jgi:sugar phosphate isomerase/epimerase
MVPMNRRDLLKTLPAAGLAVPALSQTQAGKKSRLRTAICAYSFRTQLQSKEMRYEDLVNLAVDVEADGLDLTVYWFPSTEDSFLLPLRRLAFQNAVEIYSISVRTDMCKPPGPEREKQAADLHKWVDVANKLGASHIRVFGGTVPKTSTEEQAAGWVTDMLKEAAPYAGSKGVILGLENHGGVTEKASTIIGIVKKVDSPWVGVNLDTGNFNRDAYKQIAMILPYAVNAQFKANIRDENGKSVPSDWPRIVRMFRDAGYRGYFALEYEEKEDARTAVPRLTRELNKLARTA